jgi:hypothetical protein
MISVRSLLPAAAPAFRCPRETAMATNDPALSQSCGCGCSRSAPRVVGRRDLPLLPVIALALLPNCPLCVMAWCGIVCSLEGRSWVIQVWGTPLAVGLLSVPIGAVVVRALHSRNWRPCLVAVLGSGALVAGKCVNGAWPVVYGGVGLLIVASVWSGRLSMGASKDRMNGHGSSDAE